MSNASLNSIGSVGSVGERIKSFGLRPKETVAACIALTLPNAVLIVWKPKNQPPKYDVFPDTWSAKTAFANLDRDSKSNWQDIFDTPFPDSNGNSFCSDPNT